MNADTDSGKSATTENFPVGSRFLPRHLRRPVATFYAFARTIDDIADSPVLSAAEKIARLDGFAAALRGIATGPAYATALRWKDSLASTGSSIQHGLDLISAFRQDAVQLRYPSWEGLIDYCNRSAAPVGRYLLDIHGESHDLYPLSDALCNVLQVINHLQDLREDAEQLDRIYLPLAYLDQHGCAEQALRQPKASPALRAVINHCLRDTEALMRQAAQLPGALASRRLGAESAVIVAIAQKLIRRLYSMDPLASRVKLRRLALVGPALRGVWRLVRP